MELEKIKEEILKLYPEYDRVYGPYIRKSDNRKILSLSKIGKKGSTAKQFAKVLLEIKLNKRLEKNDTVDHIDGDVTNDNIENIQLLSRENNALKGAIQIKTFKDICKFCGKEFELSKDQIKAFKQKHHKDKAGPFCSRSCSGKYGAELQNGRIDKLDRPQYDIEYYRIQDSYDQNNSSRN
jgi:hypothetical protein